MFGLGSWSRSAHDLGLGVHCDFSVAKHGEVCREVLGSDFPEELPGWRRVVKGGEGWRRVVKGGEGW
eukprot:Skav205415  [mRNA]  locus=scaffold582:78794:80080:- [translate_table: standard]